MTSIFRSTPVSDGDRRDARTPTSAWWMSPASNTYDLATAALPGLLYERLDEMGIDFSILYPSEGVPIPSIEDPELRAIACRAFNTYASELFRDFSDRLTPAAIIPMHTPQEGIAELEHAVSELCLKVAMVNGSVRRPIPKFEREYPALSGRITWLDTFGIDSQRLRSFLGQVPGTRHRGDVPHRLAGRLAALHLALHVQPGGRLRRGRRDPLQVALHGWRHPAVPGPAFRLPGGRDGLGV